MEIKSFTTVGVANCTRLVKRKLSLLAWYFQGIALKLVNGGRLSRSPCLQQQPGALEPLLCYLCMPEQQGGRAAPPACNSNQVHSDFWYNLLFTRVARESSCSPCLQQWLGAFWSFGMTFACQSSRSMPSSTWRVTSHPFPPLGRIRKLDMWVVMHTAMLPKACNPFVLCVVCWS